MQKNKEQKDRALGGCLLNILAGCALGFLQGYLRDALHLSIWIEFGIIALVLGLSLWTMKKWPNRISRALQWIIDRWF